MASTAVMRPSEDVSIKLSHLEIDPFKSFLNKVQEDIASDLDDLSTMSSGVDRNKRVEGIVARELENIKEVFTEYKSEPKKLDAVRVQWLQGLNQVMMFHDHTESSRGFVRPEGELVGALRVLEADAYMYLHLADQEILAVANAYRSFGLSSVGLQQFSPGVTGAGTANGTYFLPTADASLGVRPADLSGAEGRRSFVLKPSRQEAGTVGNPGGHGQIKHGIEGGSGAVRERFAYAVQKHLGIDLGIPFTEVIAVKHPLLSSMMGQTVKILKDINTAMETDINIDVTKLILENPQFKTIDDVLPELFKLLEPQIQNADQGRKFNFFKELFAAYNQNPQVSKGALIRTGRKVGLNIQQEPALMTLASQFLNALKGTETAPPVASIQQFSSGVKSYAMYTKQELERIPDREMHKVAVADMIILNSDRHMNNILFRDQVESYPLPILIDHGSSLPNPDGGVNLKFAARYEWMEYSQFNRPLAPELAKVILELDIEKYIENLKADQEALARTHGKEADISDECYMLVRLNLRLLKVGILNNVSVNQMAMFHQDRRISQQDFGGELPKFFADHLAGKSVTQVDWAAVDRGLEKILLTPVEERFMPT